MKSYNTERTSEFEEQWKKRKLFYEEKKYVFVIQRPDGLVRLGASKDPKTAMASISSAGMFEITQQYVTKLPYVNHQSLLRKLGDMFSPDHHRGYWYDASFESIVNSLQNLCQTHGDISDILQNKEPSDFQVVAFNWFCSLGLE